MFKSLSIYATAAALLLSSASLAQETTTESDAAEPAAEASTDDGGFAIGQEAQQDPTYIKEEYGDWQMRCFRNEAGDDPCQMFQLLRESQGNPVAEFSIFRLEEGGTAVAGATIMVPLFTLLTSDLTLSIDGGPPKSYPYRFCGQSGCVAQLGLTQADIDALKKGAAATVNIVPAQAPDQVVPIAASLKGFTAAFDNVSAFGN